MNAQIIVVRVRYVHTEADPFPREHGVLSVEKNSYFLGLHKKKILLKSELEDNSIWNAQHRMCPGQIVRGVWTESCNISDSYTYNAYDMIIIFFIGHIREANYRFTENTRLNQYHHISLVLRGFVCGGSPHQSNLPATKRRPQRAVHTL